MQGAKLGLKPRLTRLEIKTYANIISSLCNTPLKFDIICRPSPWLDPTKYGQLHFQALMHLCVCLEHT
eukprot:778713-Pelagomonas_calceolata.AAC.7